MRGNPFVWLLLNFQKHSLMNVIKKVFYFSAQMSPEFQARIFPCHILIKQWIGLFLINIKAYMLTILSWDINSQLPGFRFLKFMPCRQVTFFNQESDIIVILVKPSLKRKTETHSHLTEEKLNHKDKKPPETQLMLWDLYMALLRQTCVYILYRHTLTDRCVHICANVEP